MKYIFVTGGVVSSLGKGILSASLGALLKARGYKIRLRKMDPYLNVDPGTMNPIEHGEVFVTQDGAETDMDLGHYERFTSTLCTKYDSISSGKIYLDLLTKERNGDYLGSTVQVIPHVTDKIKHFITKDLSDEDFLICEIGGTIGDIEATPFIEAIRQFTNDVGKNNVLVILLTYLPYLGTSEELKTKPTQHAVKELQSMGVSPDILVCRTKNLIPADVKSKISLFCSVKPSNVISACDLDSVYKIPVEYHKEGLERSVLEYFFGENVSNTDNLSSWFEIEKKISNKTDTVNIALVGKYVSFKDAYKSIVEAFEHTSIHKNLKINIHWISSEDLEEENVDFDKIFNNIDGVLVAGGFGVRGLEGKIKTIQYVRENSIPFFGICLGMQMAVIEYARNVLGITDATTDEISSEGTKIICLATEWQKEGHFERRNKNHAKGGTMRLGAYPCKLLDGSLARQLYNKDKISERHRHRYEVNYEYISILNEAGLSFSGLSDDGQLAEIIELPIHRWFVAVQFHPELQSQIFNTHPLFNGFVEACYKYSKDKDQNK